MLRDIFRSSSGASRDSSSRRKSLSTGGSPDCNLVPVHESAALSAPLEDTSGRRHASAAATQNTARMAGMAFENQHTADSGVVFQRGGSSGFLREAVDTPRVSFADVRDPVWEDDDSCVSTLPPNYVTALNALDVDVVGAMMECVKESDVNVQLKGAKALRDVSRDHPECRAAIGAAGGAKALLFALRVRDQRLQCEALQALVNLTVDCPENVVLIPSVSMDALQEIVEKLDSEWEDVQEIATELVFCLSVDNSNKTMLDDSGVIPRLVKLLAVPSATCRVACKALFNIALVGFCRCQVIEDGAVKPLMALARNARRSNTVESKRIAEKALLVLKLLATLPVGWDEISGIPDWVSLMLDAIDNGTPPAKTAAVAVLLDLARHSKDHTQAIMKEDPLPVLFKACMSCEKKLRELHEGVSTKASKSCEKKLRDLREGAMELQRHLSLHGSVSSRLDC